MVWPLRLVLLVRGRFCGDESVEHRLRFLLIASHADAARAGWVVLCFAVAVARWLSRRRVFSAKVEPRKKCAAAVETETASVALCCACAAAIALETAHRPRPAVSTQPWSGMTSPPPRLSTPARNLEDLAEREAAAIREQLARTNEAIEELRRTQATTLQGQLNGPSVDSCIGRGPRA